MVGTHQPLKVFSIFFLSYISFSNIVLCFYFQCELDVLVLYNVFSIYFYFIF